MVNALRRIDGDSAVIRNFEVATAHLWFEEPNETRGRGDRRQQRSARMARRFATHPSIKERIERLARLNAGTVRLDAPLPPPAGRSGATPAQPPPGSAGDQGPFGPLRFPGMPGSSGGPGTPPPPPPGPR
jgi:hypothetical protein